MVPKVQLGPATETDVQATWAGRPLGRELPSLSGITSVSSKACVWLTPTLVGIPLARWWPWWRRDYQANQISLSSSTSRSLQPRHAHVVHGLSIPGGYSPSHTNEGGATVSRVMVRGTDHVVCIAI